MTDYPRFTLTTAALGEAREALGFVESEYAYEIVEGGVLRDGEFTPWDVLYPVCQNTLAQAEKPRKPLRPRRKHRRNRR